MPFVHTLHGDTVRGVLTLATPASHIMHDAPEGEPGDHAGIVLAPSLGAAASVVSQPALRVAHAGNPPAPITLRAVTPHAAAWRAFAADPAQQEVWELRWAATARPPRFMWCRMYGDDAGTPGRARHRPVHLMWTMTPAGMQARCGLHDVALDAPRALDPASMLGKHAALADALTAQAGAGFVLHPAHTTAVPASLPPAAAVPNPPVLVRLRAGAPLRRAPLAAVALHGCAVWLGGGDAASPMHSGWIAAPAPEGAAAGVTSAPLQLTWDAARAARVHWVWHAAGADASVGWTLLAADARHDTWTLATGGRSAPSGHGSPLAWVRVHQVSNAAAVAHAVRVFPVLVPRPHDVPSPPLPAATAAAAASEAAPHALHASGPSAVPEGMLLPLRCGWSGRPGWTHAPTVVGGAPINSAAATRLGSGTNPAHAVVAPPDTHFLAAPARATAPCLAALPRTHDLHAALHAEAHAYVSDRALVTLTPWHAVA